MATIQVEPANLLSPLGHRKARDVAADVDHGPGGANDAKSVSSRRSSKLGFKKRLSRLFKGDSKVKETVPTLAASSAPITLVGTGGHTQFAVPDRNVVPVSLILHSPADPVGTSSVMLVVPPTQVCLSSAADDSVRMDVFPENVTKPTLKADLPKKLARVDKTPQLVYCCSLFSKTQGSHSSASASDVSQDSPLDDEEKAWMQLIDPVLQGRYRWLAEQLVKAFSENPLKAPDVITEIVLVGPVLDCDTYRSLLSCFISKFEQSTTLDVTLLQGLVQLVECASSGYLVDDDLVRIATVLAKELSITYIGTSNHPLHLTLSLARVLDVMVAGK
ncbi:hypothetical protein BGZ89_007244, partial [Linnemannia elongata]